MKKTYTHPVVAAAGPVVQHTQSGIVFGNELAQPLTTFRMPYGQAGFALILTAGPARRAPGRPSSAQSAPGGGIQRRNQERVRAFQSRKSCQSAMPCPWSGCNTNSTGTLLSFKPA